jgi:hypothetical protein
MLRYGVYGLILLFVGAWFSGGVPLPAYAQSQQGQSQQESMSGSDEPRLGVVQDSKKTASKYYGIDVQEYVRKKYSVAGPYSVRSVNSKMLNLFTGVQRDLKFSLAGKQVKVLNAAGEEVGFGKVTKGTRVIVITKKAEVLIYVLPARKEQKDG